MGILPWKGRASETYSPLFLKIYPGEFSRVSRDLRELSVVQELGLETLVIAKGVRREQTMRDGWPSLLLSTRPLGDQRPLVGLNRLLSVLIWAKEARRLRATVISGHDLLGLFIGWLSTLFLPGQRRPALVYDAHELEIARNTRVRRGFLRATAVRLAESFLMRRCAFSIMVNDSIADRVQAIHGLSQRPVVVRSTPSLWQIEPERCRMRRSEFLRSLGLAEPAFLTMYHGGVMPNRGIEAIIQALVGRASVGLVVLGDGEANYIDSLRQFARERGVEDRVHFTPAVSLDVLGEYIGAVDVGMVLIPPVTESYRLCLPNKFFESVQAGTPMIASDLPEVGKLVREYDIGILVDPSNDEQIASALDLLRFDNSIGNRFRSNLKRAKTELCWEKERQRLIEPFSSLLGGELRIDH